MRHRVSEPSGRGRASEGPEAPHAFGRHEARVRAAAAATATATASGVASAVNRLASVHRARGARRASRRSRERVSRR